MSTISNQEVLGAYCYPILKSDYEANVSKNIHVVLKAIKLYDHLYYL